MLPSMHQQLLALKHRFEQTIIPEIPSDSLFAQEQARLITVTLEWLIYAVDHQYVYAVIENMDYRQFISQAQSCTIGYNDDRGDPTSCTELAAPPSKPITALAQLHAESRELKRLAAARYRSSRTAPLEAANAIREAYVSLSVRQEERERAFYLPTGYVEPGKDLGAVLEDQAQSFTQSHKDENRG